MQKTDSKNSIIMFENIAFSFQFTDNKDLNKKYQNQQNKLIKDLTKTSKTKIKFACTTNSIKFNEDNTIAWTVCMY